MFLFAPLYMNLIDRKRHLFVAERGPNGYNFLQILLLTVTVGVKNINCKLKKTKGEGRRNFSEKKKTLNMNIFETFS